MALWRKRGTQVNPGAQIGQQQSQAPAPAQRQPSASDDSLPGTADYPIGQPLPRRGRGAMPPARFRFVRPDGRRD